MNKADLHHDGLLSAGFVVLPPTLSLTGVILRRPSRPLHIALKKIITIALWEEIFNNDFAALS
jgi:hypothetical protein